MTTRSRRRLLQALVASKNVARRSPQPAWTPRQQAGLSVTASRRPPALHGVLPRILACVSEKGKR
jgi:hypothetical protein